MASHSGGLIFGMIFASEIRGAYFRECLFIYLFIYLFMYSFIYLFIYWGGGGAWGEGVIIGILWYYLKICSLIKKVLQPFQMSLNFRKYFLNSSKHKKKKIDLTITPSFLKVKVTRNGF